MKNKYYETPVYVTLSCTGERVDEKTVEFLDISEDIQGRDLITFVCPECKKEHRSYRLG